MVMLKRALTQQMKGRRPTRIEAYTKLRTCDYEHSEYLGKIKRASECHEELD